MPSSTFWGFQHINSNVLCSVQIDCTGTDPDFHEPLEICILPLDQMLEIHPVFALFNLRIRPEDKELIDMDHIRMTRANLAEVLLKGSNKFRVADLMKDWFEGMNLPENKRIIPLTYSWPQERAILIRWLGYDKFLEIFSEDYRDILTAAHFINDKHCVCAEPVIFAKQNLPWIAKKVHVERMTPGSPTGDCIAIAQIYKRLLQI